MQSKQLKKFFLRNRFLLQVKHVKIFRITEMPKFSLKKKTFYFAWQLKHELKIINGFLWLSKNNDMNQKRFLNLYSTLHYEKLTSHFTLKKQFCHYIAVKNQIISSLENNWISTNILFCVFVIFGFFSRKKEENKFEKENILPIFSQFLKS